KITSKPIIVAELASTGKGGNKADWLISGYKKVFRVLPNIVAVVYFNVDERKAGQPDWRLKSPAAALTAYSSLLTRTKFQGGITKPLVTLTAPTATAHRPINI